MTRVEIARLFSIDGAKLPAHALHGTHDSDDHASHPIVARCKDSDRSAGVPSCNESSSCSALLVRYRAGCSQFASRLQDAPDSRKGDYGINGPAQVRRRAGPRGIHRPLGAPLSGAPLRLQFRSRFSYRADQPTASIRQEIVAILRDESGVLAIHRCMVYDSPTGISANSISRALFSTARHGTECHTHRKSALWCFAYHNDTLIHHEPQ